MAWILSASVPFAESSVALVARGTGSTNGSVVGVATFNPKLRNLVNKVELNWELYPN
jgi:hypothetical protein